MNLHLRSSFEPAIDPHGHRGWFIRVGNTDTNVGYCGWYPTITEGVRALRQFHIDRRVAPRGAAGLRNRFTYAQVGERIMISNNTTSDMVTVTNVAFEQTVDNHGDDVFYAVRYDSGHVGRIAATSPYVRRFE